MLVSSSVLFACDDLAFREFHQSRSAGVTGLDFVLTVIVSPDNAHVYATGVNSDALVVFERNKQTGALNFLEVYKDGVNGIDGLQGAFSATVSPDGRHVYVAGLRDDALAVFSRDAATGLLTFIEVHKDGVAGVDGLFGSLAARVSPNGNHVYVASRFDHSVAVFARDSATGTLTFLESHHDGVNGVDGLEGSYSVDLSPDGKSIYPAGLFDDALVHFERDTETGLLTFVAAYDDGVGGVDGLYGAISSIVSPDGEHVYVASVFGDEVAVFGRNTTTGVLTFLEVHKDGIAGVDGLDGVFFVTISDDGESVYTASRTDHAVVVFTRNTDTGALTFRQVLKDGVNGADGLEGSVGIDVSPDGRNVYSVGREDNAVAVFDRCQPQPLPWLPLLLEP